MKGLPVFLTGAFGGAAPGLLRLAIKLNNGSVIPSFPFMETYGLSLVIFGFLGAGVALIWKETDLRRVFYLGIGLPALLQVSASELKAPNSPISLGFGLVGTADAQEWKEPSQFTLTRTLALDSRLSASTRQPVQVRFFDEKGTVWQPAQLDLKPSSAHYHISVPDFATSIAFQDPSGTFSTLSLDQGLGPPKQTVVLKQNPWAGLLIGLGFKDVPQYAVKFEPTVK